MKFLWDLCVIAISLAIISNVRAEDEAVAAIVAEQAAEQVKLVEADSEAKQSAEQTTLLETDTAAIGDDPSIRAARQLIAINFFRPRPRPFYGGGGFYRPPPYYGGYYRPRPPPFYGGYGFRG